ncbi:hypothetical protein [Nocardioides sp. SYSU D00038]|uniref:helix-turn-helix transcriptional regulator n=1 Tax=Nocardioides sp. SYSU D00038 TaxID=2812554 RepID=UPI0019678367|nr:hypothetical protein [Nocardioides sp. SYSU D00038]
MDRDPSPGGLSDADVEVLLRILRTRPESLADIRDLARGDDLAARLRSLRDAGFLEPGEDLTPAAPEEAVARAVAAVVAKQREQLASLGHLVEQLPALVRAWGMGAATDSYPLRGEVVEGNDKAMERWFTVTRERPPVAPGNAFADMAYIHEQFMPNLDGMRAAFEEGGYQLRLLLPADQMTEKANRDAADALIGIGVDVRVASTVPSWLYVDSGVMAGVPLRWPAPASDGFVLVYDEALVEPVHWIFRRWWAAASPWPPDGPGWEPVLRLLAQGRSDEQVAAILGQGVRTVRRRIAEAMDHYGVASRFELGMHWAGGPGPGTSRDGLG